MNFPYNFSFITELRDDAAPSIAELVENTPGVLFPDEAENTFHLLLHNNKRFLAIAEISYNYQAIPTPDQTGMNVQTRSQTEAYFIYDIAQDTIVSAESKKWGKINPKLDPIGWDRFAQWDGVELLAQMDSPKFQKYVRYKI